MQVKVKPVGATSSIHATVFTEIYDWWNLRVIMLYDCLAYEPPTDGCTTVIMYSAVRTNELE